MMQAVHISVNYNDLSVIYKYQHMKNSLAVHVFVKNLYKVICCNYLSLSLCIYTYIH